MKKILFTLILGLASLTACEKMTTIVANDDAKSITFSPNTEKSTKAIVTNTFMIDNFGVYGYVTGEGVNTAGYLMKNAEYEETGQPVAGSKYFWPKSDNPENVNVLFTAYSQYVSNPSFSEGTLTLAVPSLTQELINNPSGFDDILYAQTNASHQDAETAHYTIPLHFKHALSWIEFRAKVDNNTTITDVEITSIKFNGEGLYTTGNLVLDTKTTMVSPAVSGAATKNATLNFATSGGKTLTGGDLNKSSYSVISDALIVPQAVPESITITFNIKIQNTDGNGNNGDEIYYVGRTITRVINDGLDAGVGENPDWHFETYNTQYQAAHKYIYNILVKVDGIDFSVDVIDWGSTNFQVWDHDDLAYVEHFFDKASTMQGQSVVVTMAANSLMA